MEVGSVRKCAQCGAPIDENLTACKYCGEPSQIQPQQQRYQTQQVYQQPPVNQQFQQPIYESSVNTKSKTTAGILAILLGGLGIHKFYLGRIGTGILYILFCWTYIPAILGIIEGITYLTSSEEKFYNKYVLKKK